MCGGLLALVLMCLAHDVCLAAITEVQPVRFGSFALRNNSAQHSMAVAPDGSITADASFVRLDDGSPGVFELSGLPPSTTLSVGMADILLAPTSGGGPSFSVSSVIFDPPVPVTDALGQVTLNVGATIRTDGSGTMYSNTDFSGVAMLVVDY